MAVTATQPVTAQLVGEKVLELNDPKTSREARTQCDVFLQDFRRNPMAWGILDELLRMPSGTPEMEKIHHYAAGAIRYKVRKEKMDAASAAQLRQTLLNYIARFRGGSRVVKRQLCLAIVYSTPQSSDLVSDVLAVLNGPDFFDELLQLFILLGEEAGYTIEEVAEEEDTEQEHPLVASAKKAAPVIIKLLHDWWVPAHSSGEIPRCETIMSCFSNWLRFGALSPDLLTTSPIAQAAVPALSNVQLMESGSDVLCELACLSSKDAAGLWSPVVSFLTSHLPTIHQLFQQAAQKKDDDAASVLCRTISRIAREYANLIVLASPDALAMVRMMVDCAGHEESSVAEHTFKFFEKLRTALRQYEGPESERRRITTALTEVLLPLVSVLVKHATFPLEADKWTVGCEDEHSFLSFRDKALNECVEDLAHLIGPRTAILTAFPWMQQAVAEYPQNPSRWRTVEAVLFFVRYVYASVELCDEMNPQLLGSSELLPDHWRVRSSFVYLIGKFAWWLESKGTAFLPGLLKYIGDSFMNPQVAGVSVEAIQRLCSKCSKHMVNHFAGLLQIHEAAKGLPLKDQEKLMNGLGTVVCEFTEEKLPSAIEALCRGPLENMQANINNETVLTAELQRLTALYRGVESVERRNQTEPLARAWVVAFGAMWPVLEQVLRTSNNENVLEQLTSCVRNVLHACDVQFAPYLQSVTDALVTCFLRQPFSSILWVMATVVGVFGKTESCVQPLIQILSTLTNKTVSILRDQHTYTSDYLQELFYLLRRAARRFLPELLSTELAAVVFEVVNVSLVSTDVKRDAVVSVLEYLDAITDVASEKDENALGAFLQQPSTAPQCRGHQLVAALMQVVAIREIELAERAGDVLHQLRVLSREYFATWVHHGLTLLPADVPPNARQRFHDNVTKSSTSDDMRKAVTALHRAAGGWR